MEYSISLGIVEAIAEAEGVDPSDLDHVLEDCIDTDALEALADHEENSWRLSFEFPDHHVTVTGDGRILVDGARESRWKDLNRSDLKS